ncbi:hypothetical protein BKA67DRAFT_653280 [Truncatella angustata]|uniref:Uncharacterized protein n=1 Tax=Truncatella angustata TaxID=152316 RepID=A0A9P9A4A1_9PEZI|nr:uncharacterized protein BKA67DRAFT_653280 [Truncatella angustata]KAH6660080.1 hypothetical protein BKA67DRAFT_653280 [Truncatella angustata]
MPLFKPSSDKEAPNEEATSATSSQQQPSTTNTPGDDKKAKTPANTPAGGSSLLAASQDQLAMGLRAAVFKGLEERRAHPEKSPAEVAGDVVDEPGSQRTATQEEEEEEEEKKKQKKKMMMMKNGCKLGCCAEGANDSVARGKAGLPTESLEGDEGARELADGKQANTAGHVLDQTSPLRH